MSENERSQQEYEFIMEGITTRMQIALEKMTESNRMMSESNRRLCRMFIAALVIVVLGFIANNVIWMDRANTARGSAGEVVTDAGARAAETVP